MRRAVPDDPVSPAPQSSKLTQPASPSKIWSGVTGGKAATRGGEWRCIDDVRCGRETDAGDSGQEDCTVRHCSLLWLLLGRPLLGMCLGTFLGHPPLGRRGPPRRFMSSKKTATLPVGLLHANQTIASGARYQQRCSGQELRSPLAPTADQPVVDRCLPCQ
jgi:hypothetical protein